MQQARIADRPRSTRNPIAHQRFGERRPLPGHQAKDQRRYKKRHRTRLPRRFPRPQQDLRKTRHHLLGISRLTAGSAQSHRNPVLADNCQASLRHRLTAPSFAPLPGRQQNRTGIGPHLAARKAQRFQSPKSAMSGGLNLFFTHIGLGHAVGIAGEAHFLACQCRQPRQARASFCQKAFRLHRLEPGVPDARGLVC